MKDKKNKKDKRDKKSMKTPKKDLKTPAVPVPTAATELSEEDLKRVTGGAVDAFITKGHEYKGVNE